MCRGRVLATNTLGTGTQREEGICGFGRGRGLSRTSITSYFVQCALYHRGNWISSEF